MADNFVQRVEANSARNYVTRISIISDGTGQNLTKVFDATNVANGNLVGGQTFLPGIHTSIVGMDFDVQDMKFALYWEATANEQIGAWGASPASFDWRDIGGIRCPIGLAGATGSILLSTIDQNVNATLSLILRLRKNV